MGVYHKTKTLYFTHFDLRGHLRPLEAILSSATTYLTIVRAHSSVHLSDENILLVMISIHFFIFISIKLEVS